MKRGCLAFNFLFLFAIDRITKWWALNKLGGRILDFWLFRLRLVRNTGTAFGIGRDSPGLWLAVSVCIFVLIVFLFIRKSRAMDALELSGFIFIIPGALSNIIDRVIFGAVIDFIDLKVWPVFNLSDTWITLGVIILGYKFIFHDKKNPRKTG